MADFHAALCHEWITTYGGSEQVAVRMAKALDVSRVFTYAADPGMVERLFYDRSVEVISRLGASDLGSNHWQWLLPFMPLAWKRLDLNDFDVVLTSSHSCVNAIRVRPGAHHISYCHTPMRYPWDFVKELIYERPRFETARNIAAGLRDGVLGPTGKRHGQHGRQTT